jgi:hypothetical protein
MSCLFLCFKLDLKNTEILPDFLFVFFDFARDKCTELNPLRIKDSSWAQWVSNRQIISFVLISFKNLELLKLCSTLFGTYNFVRRYEL